MERKSEEKQLHTESQRKNDFSKGSIAKSVLRIGLPMIVAELVHVFYNVVDRMYIGHIQDVGTEALTGVGITMPLVMVINAFASFCGTGGAPLSAIARGEKNDAEACAIQETAFTLLLVIGAVLTTVFALFAEELLLFVGADAQTLPFALDYFNIYLIGTVFVLIGLGMNPFLNMQGFGRVAMGTVLIGAILNLILDPIFIYTLDMGVRGAASATVISQLLGAAWAFGFLASNRAILPLRRLRLDGAHMKKILSLGISGFCFKFTNSITQTVVNTSLKLWGGPLSTLFIGAMSIINSVREVVSQPILGMTQGLAPVAGYNYGAQEYSRVRQTILFVVGVAFGYNILVTLALQVFPGQLVGLFTEDAALIETAIPCLRAYFCAYFMMSFQMTAQHTFVALNYPKFAVFFSLLRKVILVVPLTVLLPQIGLGVMGVFYAEAASQIIGATASFTTMMIVVWRKLKQKEAEQMRQSSCMTASL